MARRLGVEKHTPWISHIDAADLVAVSGRRAVVQPSFYEGFGLAVEAVHHFFEIAGVIVRPDHVARFIVNANHSIM